MTRFWNKILAPWRWLTRHFWQLVIVGLVVVGSYSLYLDAVIQDKFGGHKTWEVPAQIYARPLSLVAGVPLNKTNLVDELKLLGYRSVSSLTGPGEYRVGKDRVDIWRRSFAFPQGFEADRRLRVSFKGSSVSNLYDLEYQRSIDWAELDPWQITRIVSQNREDRLLVHMEQVPEGLVQALVLTEDRDFYRHYGLSPLGVARALVANLRAGRTVQGGSTLTQQLVKNLFLTRQKSLWRKANEALMALLIEFRYSKDEILQAYLNEVFLGQDGATAVHGFGLASQFYFDRPLEELNQAEVATLVAIIKGPSYYHPRRHPERVLERRNLVLRMMFEHHQLEREDYQVLLESPLGIVDKAKRRGARHPAFISQVRRELNQILADSSWQKAGLRVFTTLDPLAQRSAEKTIATGLKQLEQRKGTEQLQGAMVVSRFGSGEVIAIVGDRNTGKAGFNRALDAKRSIGSLIKPAVYLTALEQPESYHLATPLLDEPVQMQSTLGSTWAPQNADKKFRGQVLLIDALTQSLNVPTVRLGMDLGLNEIAATLQNLGVEEEIKRFPALTLGAANLAPMSVNQMYQTLANGGRYMPLHSIKAITTSDNQPLWQFTQMGEQRASQQSIYLLHHALHQVTQTGTAKILGERFGANFAGKTGTSDDFRDSWFSGFDHQTLVTTWVGRDDNQPMGLSGARGALRLFSDYFEQQPPQSLDIFAPDGIRLVNFSTSDGKVLGIGCETDRELPAISAMLPPPARCEDAEKESKSWWQRLFGSD